MGIQELRWGKSWKAKDQTLDEILSFFPILMPQKGLSWERFQLSADSARVYLGLLPCLNTGSTTQAPVPRSGDGARSRMVEAADGIEAREKQFLIRQVLT